MNEPDRFRGIKLLFGTLDDLGQTRKKAYTDWVTAKIDAAEFSRLMNENLRRTREAADALEELIARRG
jgi:hypothetical protein